jgi:hypothetical protein
MVSVGCTCGLGTSQVVVEDGLSIEPVTWLAHGARMALSAISMKRS